MSDGSDDWEWLVLINDEGQYSLWPSMEAVPGGWRAVGPMGPKQVCIDYVESTWTDLRPRSVVDAMGQS